MLRRQAHLTTLRVGVDDVGRRRLTATVDHLDYYWGTSALITHRFTAIGATVVATNFGDNRRDVIDNPRRYGDRLDSAWVRAYIGEQYTVPPIPPPAAAGGDAKVGDGAGLDLAAQQHEEAWGTHRAGAV